MRDGDWRLVYSGTDITLGPGDTPVSLVRIPDLGDYKLVVDDALRAREDGVAFGQDFLSNRTIGLEMAVYADSESQARADAATVIRAWRADSIRTQSGETAELRAQYNGTEKVAYGRPRRIAPDYKNASQGVVTFLGDFETQDANFYGVAEYKETIPFVPPPSGGFTTPLLTPVVVAGNGVVPGDITVASELDVWPVFTIHGPILNPVIEVTGSWSLKLAMSIPDGESIEIDTRPWKRKITRVSDRASFAGKLTYTSVRLSKAFITPGEHEVVFMGQDDSGTSSLLVSWQDTFSSL